MINTKFSTGITYKTAKEKKKKLKFGTYPKRFTSLKLGNGLSGKPFLCFIIKYNTAVL